MIFKYDLTRVACIVPKVKPADINYNFQEIKNALESLEIQHCDILVFPELATTGYTCADLFLQTTLLEENEKQIKEFLDNNTFSGVIILGSPVRYQNLLFNAALVIQEKKILGIIPKSFIPNYKEFYEQRWFESGSDFTEIKKIRYASQTVDFGCKLLFQSRQCKDFIFGVEICEDLWGVCPPSSEMALHGALLVANISASNALVGKDAYRKQMIRQQTASCLMAYAYCSSGIGESTTDLVFSGVSYIAEHGYLLAQNSGFKREVTITVADIDLSLLLHERMINKSFSFTQKKSTTCFEVVSFDVYDYSIDKIKRQIVRRPFIPTDHLALAEHCEQIFSIQSHGLATRLEHIRCNDVVIGLSGGLDSTLALLVVLKAYQLLKLPLSGIHAVTMPGFGTTGRTLNNVLELGKALGIEIKEIDIVPACLLHMKDIGHDPEIHDTTYENVQARERTQILMSLSNKVHGITIGTGDLSEIALGWSTYNGDHMSMYAVNCGVPKTLIKYLIDYIIEKEETSLEVKRLLIDILDTPISPELLPPNSNGEINQKTEDLIGPYEVHDFYLYYLMRCGYSPSKVLFWAKNVFSEDYSEANLRKWLIIFIRRFWQNQFKRSCIPDGPKVGTIALSPRGDWRMPSDASASIWLEELQNGTR